MDEQAVVIEELFHAPVEQVWQAITDKEEMKKWYFDFQDFQAVRGFQFQFEGGPPEKTYLHLCEVTEVVPGRTLTYSWRYDGYPGDSYVTFDLSLLGEQTLLRLTHTGLETFPQDLPEMSKQSFEDGWTYILRTSLKNYLEPAP